MGPRPTAVTLRRISTALSCNLEMDEGKWTDLGGEDLCPQQSFQLRHAILPSQSRGAQQSQLITRSCSSKGSANKSKWKFTIGPRIFGEAPLIDFKSNSCKIQRKPRQIKEGWDQGARQRLNSTQWRRGRNKSSD